MYSPCIGCRRSECRDGTRRTDCLAPYPRLRAISNSPNGFKYVVSTIGWSEYEVAFYNRQVEDIHHPRLPDIL